jgi:hypothetical protein
MWQGGFVKYLDKIVITLRNKQNNLLPIYIDVERNSLSKKWLAALNQLLVESHHLEKNYCFLGFDQSDRTPDYVCDQINQCIDTLNSKQLGYIIDDYFTVENTVDSELNLNQARLNQLHRYFEDLQGVSGRMSHYYEQADPESRWCIRQLNLLCHEYENLMLNVKKAKFAPSWRRPAQLFCWLNAPRYNLTTEDYELFGINTINRTIGGIYVGVNKAVGKHHWEVFNDEGRDSRVGELTTSSLKSQTEAAGDFDIEWSRDPSKEVWQIKALNDFRQWLTDNNFDPDDKSLTIGHPKVAQVDLLKSFGTADYHAIWQQLNNYQDVYRVSTGSASAVYPYRWSDPDFKEQQIKIISQGH